MEIDGDAIEVQRAALVDDDVDAVNVEGVVELFVDDLVEVELVLEAATTAADDAEAKVELTGSALLGDVLKLQIKVNPLTGVIEDARFKTFGCGSAIASSSLATEWLKGKTVDEALGIKNTQIVEELALPPVKVHCSVLAEDAIKAAVKNYQEKQDQVAEKAELATVAG